LIRKIFKQGISRFLMANLYDAKEYQRQEISFLDKITGGGYCYILGADFSDGKPESENGLEAVSCFIDRGEIMDKRIVFIRNKGGERDFIKRVIFDKNSNLVLEVDPSLSQVDVFKGVETAKLNWGWHACELAKRKERFFYDGCLQDVLLEFEQRDYKFNLWDANWDVRYFKGGRMTKSPEGAIRKANIDEIVSMVSQEV